MIEIKICGRGGILAPQLFLSTTEEAVPDVFSRFFSTADAKKQESDATRMECGCHSIDFH
jgi:hypothetical protein